MRTIGAAKFKEQCLALLDEVDDEGIVITKRGKPVARLTAIRAAANHGYLIGIAEGEVGAAPDDDLFSTGAWVSDEWGDLNAQPGHTRAPRRDRQSAEASREPSAQR